MLTMDLDQWFTSYLPPPNLIKKNHQSLLSCRDGPQALIAYYLGR